MPTPSCVKDKAISAAATVTRADHELVLMRLIAVPRDKLFRCWTGPALIIRWFTPPMGFHEGWGIATDQLAALAATL